MTPMQQQFLGLYTLDESVALLALEHFLRVKDLHCDAASALLAIAAIDHDGSVDPNLHSYVLSDIFITRLAEESCNSGGQDIFCPPAFIAAKDAYISAGKSNSLDLDLNNFIVSPP